MLFSFIVQLFTKLWSMIGGDSRSISSSRWHSSSGGGGSQRSQRTNQQRKSMKSNEMEDKSCFKLAKNMVFRYCGGGIGGDDKAPTKPRPLILLFAWMDAKDLHIEKYRQFWYERGFDVLSLTTSAADLLLPTVGASRNGRNVLRFLSEIKPTYSQVLIHAFSVGCFQSLEFVRTLREDGCGDLALQQQIDRSIRGIIFDSCAYMDEFEKSFSIAVTKSPIKQTLIRVLGQFYVKLVCLLTNNRYGHNQNLGFENKTNIPGLLLYSKDDQISLCRLNDKLSQVWSKNGVVSRAKCWQNSAHVQHYRNYPEEYQQEVDQFISMIENYDGKSLRTTPSNGVKA